MFIFQETYFDLTKVVTTVQSKKEIDAYRKIQTVEKLAYDPKVPEEARQDARQNLEKLKQLHKEKRFDEVINWTNDWVKKYDLQDIFNRELRKLELQGKELAEQALEKMAGKQALKTLMAPMDQTVKDQKEKDKIKSKRKEIDTVSNMAKASQAKPPKIPPPQVEIAKADEAIVTEQGMKIKKGPKQDT